MVKKKNPLMKGKNHLWGFAFATVFFIMFFSSQMTQNRLNVIDANSIASEITKDLQISCVEDVRCNTRDVPPNLPEPEFRSACASACATITQQAEEVINDRIDQEIDQEIGFFTGLFFNPSGLQVGLTVIILYVLGFIFGAVINRK